ncbi:MAG TPA: DUF5004 domain-containing protein [Mucilaginibacter sp.]|jgi:hypothetical protein
MKRLSFLILLCLLFIACNKNQRGSPLPVPPMQATNKLSGKWTLDSVTTVFRDPTGKTIGKNTSSQPGWSFQFNDDKTWGETLTANNLTGLASNGTYVINSDTTFTLTTAAYSIVEPCKIFSISPSSLVFSHQRPTLFNGVTPGTEEYILTLTK